MGAGGGALQASKLLGINLQLISHIIIIIMTMMMLLLLFFVFLGIASFGDDRTVHLLAGQSFFWITGYYFASFLGLLNCWENRGGLGFMPGRGTAGDQLWVHASTVLLCPFGPIPYNCKKEKSCQTRFAFEFTSTIISKDLIRPRSVHGTARDKRL